MRPRTLVLITGALIVTAALARWWLPPLLDFTGTNANKIQGLQSLVQLVLWLSVLVLAIAALWRKFLARSRRPGGLRGTLGPLFPQRSEGGGTAETRSPPSQAPPLPPYFVDRPEILDALEARLLRDDSPQQQTLVITVLSGLAGIGKSTAAAWIAQQPEVHKRYPDGVLWAPLGQNPDVTDLLSTWIHELGDDTFPRDSTAEAASLTLRTLLREKQALLIVDDAWDLAHVNPFLAGGPRCHVLLTTRERGLAQALGIKPYELDIMTPDQAVSLFERHLGRRLDQDEHTSARKVARLVGHLPLALTLAAAQIDDKSSWAQLLADLSREIDRLDRLEVAGAQGGSQDSLRSLSLRASLNLSLRRLSRKQLRCFAWLGVLPEDELILPAMTATLWEVDQRTAQQTLRILYQRALLLHGDQSPGDSKAYRLHDVMHSMAIDLLTGPTRPAEESQLAGLGLDLKQAHTMLLDRYAESIPSGHWHDVADDGYIHARLLWHIERAGKLQALHELMVEQTSDGANGWFQARARLGQLPGYLTDLASAWSAADRESRQARTSSSITQAVALHNRYALMTTSLNSVASSISASLLVALVRAREWEPMVGVAYAGQIPGPEERRGALVGLLPFLAPPVQEEVLQRVLGELSQLEDSTRGEQVVAVAAAIARAGYGDEALDAVVGIPYVDLRAQGLADIAPHLSSEHVVKALPYIRPIKDPTWRVQMLVGLLPALPAVLRRLLSLSALLGIVRTQRIDSSRWPKTSMSSYRSRVPNRPERPLLARRGLTEEMTRTRDRWTTLMLLSVLPHTPLPIRRLVVKRALRSLEASKLGADEILLYPLCLPFCSAPQRKRLEREGLAQIGTVLGGSRRFGRSRPLWDPAIEDLLCYLPESFLVKAYQQLRPATGIDAAAGSTADIDMPRDPSDSLLPDIIAHMPGQMAEQVAEQVQAQPDREALDAVVAACIKRLAGVGLGEAALALVNRIQDPDRHQEMLRVLATAGGVELPRAAWAEVLEAAQQVDDVADQLVARAGMAAQLSQADQELELAELLAQLLEVREEWEWGRIVARLAPYLPIDTVRDLAQAVLHKPSLHHLALIPLLRRMAELQDWNAAVSFVRQQIEGKKQAFLLEQLANSADGSTAEQLHQEALTKLTFPEEWLEDAERLARARLTDSMLGEALDFIERDSEHSEYWNSRYLHNLGPHLPPALVDRAFEHARRYKEQRYTEHAFVGLVVAQARSTSPERALETVQALTDPEQQAEALARLAPSLTSGLATALSIVQAMGDSNRLFAARNQVPALRALLPFVKEDPGLRSRALAIAHGLGLDESNAGEAAYALVGFLPYVDASERQHLRAEVRALALRSLRLSYDRDYFSSDLQQALIELAPYLTETEIQETLEHMATWMSDADSRQEVFIGLVPRVTALPQTTLVPAWSAILHRLATRTRSALLGDLAVLAPVIAKAGGQDCVAKTCRMVKDVGRWWP